MGGCVALAQTGAGTGQSSGSNTGTPGSQTTPGATATPGTTTTNAQSTAPGASTAPNRINPNPSTATPNPGATPGTMPDTATPPSGSTTIPSTSPDMTVPDIGAAPGAQRRLRARLPPAGFNRRPLQGPRRPLRVQPPCPRIYCNPAELNFATSLKSKSQPKSESGEPWPAPFFVAR